MFFEHASNTLTTQPPYQCFHSVIVRGAECCDERVVCSSTSISQKPQAKLNRFLCILPVTEWFCTLLAALRYAHPIPVFDGLIDMLQIGFVFCCMHYVLPVFKYDDVMGLSAQALQVKMTHLGAAPDCRWSLYYATKGDVTPTPLMLV